MNNSKKKAIEGIVDAYIKAFAEGLLTRYIDEVYDPTGVINAKKNNCFIAELGEEFMLYSALVRSFDSSFGNVLEKMRNGIAELTYTTENKIDSYILPAQLDKIKEIIDSYTTDSLHRIAPDVNHYKNYTCIKPRNISSFRREHVTDHCFYDENKDIYYLIELKAGGDLDTKKAPAEKNQLLIEYFMLKNKLESDNKKSDVKLYFGTAYNKYGEGNEWRQGAVQSCFSKDELLIGKDYWNFVCDDKDGFEIVFNQYKISCKAIKDMLIKVKNAYFKGTL